MNKKPREVALPERVVRGKPRAEQTTLDDKFLPLPLLSCHSAVAATTDKAFDGTALFVVLAMYQAFSVLDRDQVEELAKVGLSPIHFNILATLQRANSPTTVGALSSMLFVRSNNMSGNINALIRMGLIERQVNPRDSRSFLIELTTQGHEFLNQTLPGHWSWLEQLMNRLSTKERMQLVELLKKMVNSIQAAHLARDAE
ncbi:MarR family winged helix-turn-helix transcriptional regulator [Ferribacterium limneticum]|uniref:MarR family winged helix-turn-helix transcriptional regulator n=1 Tax=Ferribacterium limneticum TaxID=76259 RepID=UPI001CFC38B9|nr:MarR family transcriptional regulator [Ferribacterium limneticum]UCV17791.1 MarR family transcriptional regulator [Ferribacterium limneticum]